MQTTNVEINSNISAVGRTSANGRRCASLLSGAANASRHICARHGDIVCPPEGECALFSHTNTHRPFVYIHRVERRTYARVTARLQSAGPHIVNIMLSLSSIRPSIRASVATFCSAPIYMHDACDYFRMGYLRWLAPQSGGKHQTRALRTRSLSLARSLVQRQHIQIIRTAAAVGAHPACRWIRSRRFGSARVRAIGPD